MNKLTSTLENLISPLENRDLEDLITMLSEYGNVELEKKTDDNYNVGLHYKNATDRDFIKLRSNHPNAKKAIILLLVKAEATEKFYNKLRKQK